MNSKKILQLVRRVRSAYAANDQDLAEIEAELEKDQVPDPPRQRRNLKIGRIEEIERRYASNRWIKR